ncbi:MAG: hypothetical protein WBO77_01340 [Microgenomates group bacterium]
MKQLRYRRFRIAAAILIALLMFVIGLLPVHGSAHAQTTDPMDPTPNGCIEIGPVFSASNGANVAVKSKDETDVTFLHILNADPSQLTYYSLARANTFDSVKVHRTGESLRVQYLNCNKQSLSLEPRPNPEHLLRREITDKMKREPKALFYGDPFTLLKNGDRFAGNIGVDCILTSDTIVVAPGEPTSTPVPLTISSEASSLIKYGDTVTVADPGITKLRASAIDGALMVKDLSSCTKNGIISLLVGYVQRGYVYVDPDDVIESFERLVTPAPTRTPLPRPTIRPLRLIYLPSLSAD